MEVWDRYDGSLQRWVQGACIYVFLLSFHLPHLTVSTTHVSMRCAKDMHVCMHPPPCNFSEDKHTSTGGLLLSQKSIAHPPTHTKQRARDKASCKEIFLRYFSQSLLTSCCTPPPPIMKHTQKAHSIFRTRSTSTQQETTLTWRSGFTLLEKLEALRVETEEN